ncbi:MAG: hypothetical protein ACR2MS_00360 [Weeksellaceae bacterium]
MKYTLTILSFFCLIFNYAQEVSDYKYVSVPIKFSDFDANEYSLNNQLKIWLKKKNYEPLPSQRQYWPEEAKLNPCRVLTADLLDTGTMFRNKLTIKLSDCNNSVVLEQEAESNIKDYQKGFSDALEKLMSKIVDSDAQDDIVNPTKNEVTIVTKTTTPPAYQKMLPKEKQTKPTTKTYTIEEQNSTYKNTDIKITALNNNEIMVLDVKNSKVLAHFYPAKLEGIYHVKINTPQGTSYYTIGYKDAQGNLSYEKTSDFQQWELIELN